MENPNSPPTLKSRIAKHVLAALVVLCPLGAFWFFLDAQWHRRDNLPKEYEEFFATPFSLVNVTEYWNSSVGHGTKFAFSMTSTVPIQIKDESSYETTSDIPEKSRYPWAVTSLSREREAGDVSILLDHSRQMGYVRVQTPFKTALMRDGRRFSAVANFPWPNELTPMHEAWNEEWSKRQEAKGFQIHKLGSGETVVSIEHVMDASNMQPDEFEQHIRQYLRELEAYTPEDEFQKVDEKLLELHVPNRSLSEAQVQALSKIATELSANYAEPFDGATWRIKSRNGKIPMRFKVIVFVNNPNY